MEGAITGVIQTVFHQKAAEKPQADLLSEIETVRQNLDAVSALFEYQSDPDLVESCIYEMQSLAAKYRYLLREARRLGITGEVTGSLYHV